MSWLLIKKKKEFSMRLSFLRYCSNDVTVIDIVVVNVVNINGAENVLIVVENIKGSLLLIG